MKKIVLLIFILINFKYVFPNIKISFINPGKSDEVFWTMVTDFMKAAAEDLEINLEVIYAERNFLKQVTIMEEITSRNEKPDYIIIVNEKLIASRLLNISDKIGVKTFMILNELTEEQIKYYGKPRGIHKNWLGTLVPNNIDAGYMIAESIMKKAELEKNNLNLLAIAGNRATPASVERVNGLQNFLKKKQEIKHIATVFSEWTKEEAYIRTKNLLFRYDNKIDLIWGVNDLAALGALQAIEEAGLEPSKDVYIGGLNWSNEALRKIQDGDLVSSVGGHFMIGGWALVILKDYHEGIDFFSTEVTSELKVNSFGVLDSSNIQEFSNKFDFSNWSKIDFKKYSKFYNQKIKKYNFDIDQLLEDFQ